MEKHDKTRVNMVAVQTAIFGLLLVVMLVFSILTYARVNTIVKAINGDVQPQQEEQPAPQPQQGLATADDDPVLGDKNAPVEIIEFSDFQCPFCGRFYSQSMGQIKEKYVDTGKVKIVFRDFPLGFHQFAQKSSEAAECADEQGKFWEYHDKLFESQDALDTASLKQYASELGLDTAKFNSCLDTGKYASEVSKDLSDGTAAGVSGTPSFFINGQKIVGAQPYSVFEAAIEAALNE
ncbi:DsbA family protein [Candidatus Woesearchaeota archaeon]|nr:MAG: DsbA family protein [Candidatus Woesearchaeota archaeon]